MINNIIPERVGGVGAKYQVFHLSWNTEHCWNQLSPTKIPLLSGIYIGGLK